MKTVACWVMAACLPASALGASSLRYLGHVRVETRQHVAADVVLGGLSGLEHDARHGIYWAISDDRSAPRCYGLTIDLSDGRLTDGDVRVRSVVPLESPGPADGEAVRLHPETGRLWWTSEGDARFGIVPRVVECRRDGGLVRSFLPPPVYLPGAPGWGIRPNQGFESLSFTPDGRRLVLATESALVQDGELATPERGSPCRVLVLDAETGRRLREHVYWTEPAPDESADCGLVELIALGRRQYLTLERSWSREQRRNTIRLFHADARGATNVARLGDLDHARRVRPVGKRLLLDLDELGIRLDNFEGMTLGPVLPDGSRSLVLVSDDNFNERQETLIVAFGL